MLAVIPSCGLIGSILKIPGSILKTAGRTVGVSRLTDDKPQPEQDLKVQKTEENTTVTPHSAE